MRPYELREAGRALYGERWQTALARALRVTDRTVRRWVAGEFVIPGEAERDIRAALERRRETLGRMAKSSIPGRKRLRGAAPSGFVYGFMKGTVVIPPGLDLTEAVAERFSAEDGELHR